MKGKGRFGYPMVLSETGDTALVAGVQDRGEHGAVWAFTRGEGTTWTQQGSKLTTNAKKTGAFGKSLALTPNGDTAMIGAPGGPKQQKGLGAAFAFSYAGEKWSPSQTLSAPPGEGRKFGEGVALSGNGNTALIAFETSPTPTVTVWSK